MIKIKKIIIADRIAVMSASLAQIYMIIYSIFIFPSLALAQIEVNADSLVGAFGVVLGTAIGVTVAAIILAIISVLMLVITIVCAVLLKFSHKALTPPRKIKKAVVFTIVSGFLLVLMTVFSFIMLKSQYPPYIPTCVLSAISTISFAVGLILKHPCFFEKK